MIFIIEKDNYILNCMFNFALLKNDIVFKPKVKVAANACPVKII